MIKVLVVPSGTEVAQEIVRSLSCTKNLEIYGANTTNCFTEIPKSKNFLKIPYVDESDFIDSIIEIVKKNAITHIFPAHDSASIKLSKYATELGAKVVSSGYKTNKICRSKTMTYEFLKGVVRVPKVYSKDDCSLIFPLFVKPDIGQGSVGAKLIKSQSELSNVSENAVICEYLPGEEYTVDCVTDSNEKLIYARARKRLAMRSGIATETELVLDNEPFYKFAGRINSKLLLKGAWFFQVKVDVYGQLCLLEVATRIAGSMITNRLNGINFAELSILISDNIQVKAIPNNLNIKLFRNLSYQFETNLKYDTAYIDFDDCLIFGDKVNVHLINFIYQCINRKIKVILITRHAREINETLYEMRLYGVFDEIIHIVDNSPKSKFIKNINAIFIDDSFKEREDVRLKCNIPCFSVDMVQGLICLKS